MTRRFASLLLPIILVVSFFALPTMAAASSAPLPTSMAAVGDSITQAASTGGGLGTNYPANSWSTGTNATVNSHFLRLRAAQPDLVAWNLSVSGAKVADLGAQMQAAVALQPEYLTVLIGGNDLCTDTVGSMTSVTTFRASLEAAMATLTAGSPDTYVYFVSIPDVYQLWNLFRNNWWARVVWSAGDICQSLLANPTSTQQVDVQRRAAVRQRNIDFNAQLASVCAAQPRCVWDGNAAFNTAFAPSDVSGDYFHPSTAGQAKLASVTWGAGYTWTTEPPPPPPNEMPVADFEWSCDGLDCSFTDTSTDDVGVVTHTWSFGDDATSNEPDPGHAYGSAGSYPVTLTVSDGSSAIDSVTKTVTVTEAPAPSTMTVASLSGSAQSVSRNSWRASVTILVSDAGGSGVAGATVSTAWSSGAPDTCTTGADGRCTVVSDNLNGRKVTSVTLSVAGVTHPDYVWDAPSPLPAMSLSAP